MSSMFNRSRVMESVGCILIWVLGLSRAKARNKIWLPVAPNSGNLHPDLSGKRTPVNNNSEEI